MSIEDNYFMQIYSRLDRVAENSDTYNFECPFCHEGDSAGHKRRGFIYKNDKYKFYCFNCSKSVTFKSFLYELDRPVYYRYVEDSKEDRFYDTTKRMSRDRTPVEKKIQKIDSSTFDTLSKEFTDNMYPVTDNPDALMYLRSRRVPEETIARLRYYCGDYKHPGLNESIIFPFWTSDDRIYGFQSRNLWQKRFNIQLQNPNYPKLWNLFHVDVEKPVYIFEGFFDSIVIENSIALNGADIDAKYLAQIKKPVFVMDADKTGQEKARKYARLGHDVFIYPDKFPYKDFNEFYCRAKPKKILVERFIQKNVQNPDMAEILSLARSLR
jgi:hypothetical protein